MENMHAPTVSSGPTSLPAGGLRTAGLTLPQLEEKKGNLEAELRALGTILQSHGVDMNTSLLTADGFPRDDLDVAQIRTTRTRIICLRNDYKELMAVIEKAVHAHFEWLQKNPAAETNGAAQGNAVNGHTEAAMTTARLEPPFAKVNSVVENSPAQQAGLRPQDIIREFGYVNGRNHDGLKKVAECVMGNEGQEFIVKVSRGLGSNARELELSLVPRKDWGGRGMLGCHVVPI